MGYDARQAAKAWNLLSIREKASPLPFALYLQIPDFSGFFASGFYAVRTPGVTKQMITGADKWLKQAPGVSDWGP